MMRYIAAGAAAVLLLGGCAAESPQDVAERSCAQEAKAKLGDDTATRITHTRQLSADRLNLDGFGVKGIHYKDWDGPMRAIRHWECETDATGEHPKITWWSNA